MSWSDFYQRLKADGDTELSRTIKNAEIETRRGQKRWGVCGGWLKRTTEKKHATAKSCYVRCRQRRYVRLWTMYSCYLTMPQLSAHHLVKGPRYRLIPLSRPVTAEEYELACGVFGMDNFDDTTYQAERLMYWQSFDRRGIFR